MHAKPTTTAAKPRLLDQVRNAMRVRHMSWNTEKTYVHWIRRFIRFHGLEHPAKMAEPEINAFLQHLATQRRVSASTQTQALCAILFLYRHVLDREIGELERLIRVRRKRRLPVVLTREEVRAVLSRTQGTNRLLLTMLYGTGMRLAEGLSLRVKDLDFRRREIVVREGKGDKDRVTVLPAAVAAHLRQHLKRVAELHRQDLDAGFGRVYLPHALARKYPSAAAQWHWQFVFPARNISKDPRSGVRRRHHLYPRSVQRAFRRAVQEAKIAKHATDP